MYFSKKEWREIFKTALGILTALLIYRIFQNLANLLGWVAYLIIYR